MHTDLTNPDLLNEVLDAMPDPTVVGRALRDPAGSLIDFEVAWMNASGRAVLGRDSLGRNASAELPWSEDLLGQCLEVLESGEPAAGEVISVGADGRPIGFSWRAVRVAPEVLLWVQSDLGGALQYRHHLAAAEARLRAALAQSFDGHAFFRPDGDVWMISWANEEFLRLDADGHLTADISGMVANVHETGRRISELVPVAGKIFEVRLYPVENEVAVTVADETEMFSTTAGLVWDVLHDPLTGIGNRSKLQQDLSASLVKGGAATVLCLDLDGFKEVNDSMGHAAGDDVLRQIATRIAGALRDGEEAYRLGGDEFVVIAGPLGRGAVTAVARRIAAMVVEPVPTPNGESVSVSVSIGATVGTTSEEPATIIGRADTALYEAKRTGEVVEFA